MAGQMRDRRAGRDYFEELIASNQQAVVEGRRDAADEDLRAEDLELYVDLVQIYRSAAFSVANASYSIGDPLTKTAEYVVEVIAAETLFARYEPLAGNTYRLTNDPGDYVRPLQVLSLAILLDLDAGVEAFVKALGSSGEDAVYDFLADRSHEIEKVGTAVAWPKPYASLLEFLHHPSSTESMQRFLHNWYNQNRRGLPWGTHLRIDEGSRSYSGYWCFEAAAVTKLLDVDDSAYRDNEYYPRDLLTV